MTFRSLAVAPFVLTALTAVILLFTPAPLREEVSLGEVDVSKLLALGGMAAAALAFERGDYLRRGWGTWTATYVFLLGRDALLLGQAHVPPMWFDLARSLLVTAANACVIVAAWTLARAWGVAGLEHPGSTTGKRALAAAAIAAAVLLAGPTLVVDVRALSSGTFATFGSVSSDLGDIVSLSLIAPLALTALAVRGGTLRWPWTLLTASLVAWLLYDALYTVPDYLHAAAGGTRLVSEQFHVLAGACAGAAGLAQRKAVTEDDDAEPED
jgi:hypothetical protein